MKKSNYVHALLWVPAVVGSFYLETFWYAKIRYIREVSFFDYRLTLIAVSMLVFTISMLLIYKIQEREGKKNMSKEKQIDIIRDLLVEFDEMGFIPTTTVPNPDAYAIKWRDEITKALVNYRKQSEWISVDERLPELHTYVLTYDTVSGDVQIDSVLSNGEFVIGYNVTHWMPLPEAPKGGAE